jgi:hypothetical protein
MKALIALVVFSAGLFAQSALVIQLKPEDSARLATTIKAKVEAAKALEDEEDRIQRLYLVVDEGDPDAGNNTWTDPKESGLSIGSGYGWVATIGTTTIKGPCASSWESVACLKVRLAEAQDKESAGQKPAPRVKLKYYRSGWANGFEPSKDFKFIVPKPAAVLTPANSWYGTTRNVN